MLQGQQRTLPLWIDDIHAQQTISMGFSKYRRSHTIIFFIILVNEKSVSISVYLENKTTIIRLSPCVHITFWTVTFRFLWMLTSYVTGGCCHISVVSECYGSPIIVVDVHDICVNRLTGRRLRCKTHFPSNTVSYDWKYLCSCIWNYFYNACVLSSLLYACEYWTPTERNKARLDAFEMRYQVKILQVVWFQHYKQLHKIQDKAAPA